MTATSRVVGFGGGGAAAPVVLASGWFNASIYEYNDLVGCTGTSDSTPGVFSQTITLDAPPGPGGAFLALTWMRPIPPSWGGGPFLFRHEWLDASTVRIQCFAGNVGTETPNSNGWFRFAIIQL